MSDSGRVPPNNLEAEASVLGGIFLRNDAIGDVIERGVTEETFYLPTNRAIFAAMVELHEAGKPIDVITVADYLKSNKGQRRAAVSESELVDLAARVPTASNIGHYAQVIADKAAERDMISACGEIVGKGFADPPDAAEYLSWAESRVSSVAERKQRQDFVRVRQLANDAMERLTKRHEQKQHVSGVPTGYADLDRLTAGFQPSDLIILAARPSMGKSAMALNVAVNCALSAGIPSLIFSLEMSKASLIDRMICINGQIDGQRMRTGQLSGAEWPAVAQSMARLSDLPIDIDDSASLTVAEIRSKARRWRRNREMFQHGDELGLIAIDYLQLVHGGAGKHGENRDQELGRISNGLKSLAKELGVPVMALSQLNRSVEKREDKRPLLSDLRESGNIEQDADVVCFLYREWVYNPTEENRRDCDVIVGKQRNGPIGTIPLLFVPEHGRFENRAWSSRDSVDDRPPPAPRVQYASAPAPRDWHDTDGEA